MPLVHASAATWLVAVSAAAGVLPVASAGEAAAAELSRGHEQEAHPGSAGAETATWGGDEPGVGRPVDPQTGDFPPRYSTHNDLALAALIAEALARNPRVRAASFRHQAALQRVPQAEALPDPTFALTQYAIAPQTRVGPQTTMLSVSQRLPWFGKLSNQGDIAAAGAGAEGQLLQARRCRPPGQAGLLRTRLRRSGPEDYGRGRTPAEPLRDAGSGAVLSGRRSPAGSGQAPGGNHRSPEPPPGVAAPESRRRGRTQRSPGTARRCFNSGGAAR